MWLDHRVATRKFERQVAQLDRQQETLRTWGCWIQEVAFPSIHVVFLPRHRLQVSLLVNSPLLLSDGKPVQQAVTIPCPSLGARGFGVRLGLDDFDQRPISVTFVDPWTRSPLKFDEMVRAQHETAPGQRINVLLDGHPTTGLPFLCMRGIREYHEHPQHSGDDWMLYRGDLGVFTVLSTIWRTCLDSARPHFLIGAGTPQILWEAGVRAS